MGHYCKGYVKKFLISSKEAEFTEVPSVCGMIARRDLKKT